MRNTFRIKDSLRDTLKEIGCDGTCDEITVYKREKGKVFFKAGRCRLHLSEKEFEESIVEEQGDT